MKQSHIPQKEISAKERGLSLFLLSLLIVIAGVVWVFQKQYDPGKWREHAKTAEPSQGAANARETIAGLVPLSSEERYDTNNLSDKINGKAELYLSAGFKQLETQRFGFDSDSGRWMERYVYHMDGPRSAYAVFSAQRRSDVEPLQLGGYGYRAANGLFMVHGSFYVEIIAAEVSEDMRIRSLDLARSFVVEHQVVNTPLEELDLFPDKDRIPNSQILVAADAFGLAGLNWVFTCRYADEADEAIAFIALRASVADADDLAQSFINYWRDYGGETVEMPEEGTSYRTVTILDNYEIVWVEGKYLIGVHEATDLEFGVRLTERMRQTVRQGRHDS